MTLDQEWKLILRRAWSVRFMLLAAALTLSEVALQFLSPSDLHMTKMVFASLAGLASAAAFVARLVAQRDVP